MPPKALWEALGTQNGRANASDRDNSFFPLCLLVQVGDAIEGALGSAQDVEGVVEEDGSITVVQTRPQV